MAGVLQKLLALGLQLARHPVEDTAEHGDLVVALLLPDLRVEVARTHPLGRAGEAADGPRQPFGEPQSQPDRREDEEDREAEVEEPELEHEAPAFRLELLVEAYGLLRVVEQREDFAVHGARKVEESVAQRIEATEHPELVVVPVLEDNGSGGRRGDLLRRGALEVEQVGPLAPGLDLSRAIDHERLAQPALDQALSLREDLAQLAVRKSFGACGGAEELRERVGVLDQRRTLLALVRLGGGQRRSDDVAHPVREPALKPDVDGDPREDRHRHRWHERDEAEDPGQLQVQLGAGRLRPPRRNGAHDLLEHQRGDRDRIDEIGQQDEAERRRVAAPVQRPEDGERRCDQDRREKHEAKRRPGADSVPAPNAGEAHARLLTHRARQEAAPPTSSTNPPCRPVTASCGSCRNGPAPVCALLPGRERSNTLNVLH